VRRLLVTANVVPGSPILLTVMIEALSSSETSVLTRTTRRNISEDGILHSHLRENLKSYIALTSWALYRGSNVSPVRYELFFNIPEDDILHSDRHENLISYKYNSTLSISVIPSPFRSFQIRHPCMILGTLYSRVMQAVAQWLRRCATSRKVADSRPD
jgi:hypothetical protein